MRCHGAMWVAGWRASACMRCLSNDPARCQVRCLSNETDGTGACDRARPCSAFPSRVAGRRGNRSAVPNCKRWSHSMRSARLTRATATHIGGGTARAPPHHHGIIRGRESKQRRRVRAARTQRRGGGGVPPTYHGGGGGGGAWFRKTCGWRRTCTGGSCKCTVCRFYDGGAYLFRRTCGWRRASEMSTASSVRIVRLPCGMHVLSHRCTCTGGAPSPPAA